MSSTSSKATISRFSDLVRHPRILRTHIVAHVLIITTALFLLMQLIAHTAATQGVEDFGMPVEWKEEFVRQLVEGTKTFTWVVMYLLVPLDILHALLCMGWYNDRLRPVLKKREGGERRKKLNTWMRDIYRKLPTWMRRNHAAFVTEQHTDSRVPASSALNDVPRPVKAPKTIHQSNQTPLEPNELHAYHPLLRGYLSPLQRLVLLTLFDILMILTLASHIYVFVVNIKSGLDFCKANHTGQYLPIFPDPPEGSPQLGMRARCRRMNWSIHSAGGWSAGGAAVLAGLHAWNLGFKIWDYVWERTMEQRKGRKRDEEGWEMQNWHNEPRDVDVRSRSRSCSELQMVGGLRTASQEEASVGLRLRRRREERGVVYEEGVTRESKWDEGFLECLA